MVNADGKGREDKGLTESYAQKLSPLREGLLLNVSILYLTYA